MGLFRELGQGKAVYVYGTHMPLKAAPSPLFPSLSWRESDAPREKEASSERKLSYCRESERARNTLAACVSALCISIYWPGKAEEKGALSVFSGVWSLFAAPLLFTTPYSCRLTENADDAAP